MTNKKLGNKFESFFCSLLFSNGYWVHNLAQNQSGQPADVIAAKNGTAYLIDCKVCSGKGFPLSRVEENQDSSMSLWKACGNGELTCLFALEYQGEIYMLPHSALELYKGKSMIPGEDIVKYLPIKRWMEYGS